MRKTLQRYNDPGHAHFLTFSCFKRQKVLTSERALTWLGESLSAACARHDIALWGYVFMPEHVHLVVKPRNLEYDISRFLFSFKGSVTKKAHCYRHSSGKPDTVWERFYDIQPSGKFHFRFWQRGGGHDVNLDSPDDVRVKLIYMHNNPVKRGLCETPLDWRWSSASFYETGEAGPIPVETAVI
jgi:putative transposase